MIVRNSLCLLDLILLGFFIIIFLFKETYDTAEASKVQP